MPQRHAPPQVHPREQVELLRRGLLDALVEGAHARVVDQHVHGAEGAGPLHERAHRLRIGDVAGDGDGVRAQRPRRRLQRLRAARAHHHARARRHERLRDGVADAARAARDDRRLPLQRERGPLRAHARESTARVRCARGRARRRPRTGPRPAGDERALLVRHAGLPRARPPLRAPAPGRRVARAAHGARRARAAGARRAAQILLDAALRAPRLGAGAPRRHRPRGAGRAAAGRLGAARAALAADHAPR